MRTFPIQRPWSESSRLRPTKRTSIPWDLIAPHERQMQRNHCQSTQRLSERGGLSACEAVCVIEDRAWEMIQDDEADKRLDALVVAWEAAQSKPHQPPTSSEPFRTRELEPEKGGEP